MKAVGFLRRWATREQPATNQSMSRPSGAVFTDMPEELPVVDFPTASFDDLLRHYLLNGCVLLRRFADLDRLAGLIASVNEWYANLGGVHIHPCDLRDRGLPQFHEYIFDQRHRDLLSRVFGTQYEVSEETTSRRIDPTGIQGQPPLGPHLDAFVHRIAFTVNFWVPFADCGGDTPSLGVVRASFEEMASYSGYDGGAGVDAWNPGWVNFAHFSPPMLTLARAAVPGADLLRGSFGDRVWTPNFSLGDAMMSSNWTLHFTHALQGSEGTRGNVELRFLSDRSMAEIVARHTATP
jgi:hypothetical protein